jgi:predicted site-specific integrase-resolvase
MSELLQLKDIARLTHIGVSTLHRWNRSGKMPAPIYKNQQLQRWPVEVVQRWITVGLCDRKTFEKSGAAHE